MSLTNLSKAELAEMVQKLQQQAQATADGLMVKTNSSGGVFIRHSSFVEWSKTKDKEYVAGINIGKNTAKALFGNPELLKQVVELIKQL